MNSAPDFLQPVPDENLTDFKEVFKENWPYAIYIYYFIDNYIERLSRNANLNTKIYCPEGKWQSGVIVAITDDCYYGLTVFSLKNDDEQLYKALIETKLINWERGIELCMVHEQNVHNVKKALLQRGVDVDFEDHAGYWWIPKKDAKNFKVECPTDVYLGPLKEVHVEEINSVWPYRSQTSHDYITKLIKYNGGMGLFLKENDILCSWIMKNNCGLLGILQTKEEYRRKGYGSLVTKSLAKSFAEKDLDICLFIFDQNTASQSMFRSIGFKWINRARWIHTRKLIQLHTNCEKQVISEI